MQVIAILEGYYGGRLQAPGDIFEVADGTKGSWFEPVDQVNKKPAGKRKSATPEPDAQELI